MIWSELYSQLTVVAKSSTCLTCYFSCSLIWWVQVFVLPFGTTAPWSFYTPCNLCLVPSVSIVFFSRGRGCKSFSPFSGATRTKQDINILSQMSNLKPISVRGCQKKAGVHLGSTLTGNWDTTCICTWPQELRRAPRTPALDLTPKPDV